VLEVGVEELELEELEWWWWWWWGVFRASE